MQIALLYYGMVSQSSLRLKWLNFMTLSMEVEIA